MESIVLAISGLSLLGVSAVLRRTADKHIHTVRPNNYAVHEALNKKAGFAKPAFEGKALLPQQAPTLLSSESSSQLHQ